MERSEILATMGELKLYGMKAAFDEIITTAVKRQHEPQRIVGDLLSAEIAEKQARSIKYQITIAKLPLAKDVGDFVFDGTPLNETLGDLDEAYAVLKQKQTAPQFEFKAKIDNLQGQVKTLKETLAEQIKRARRVGPPKLSREPRALRVLLAPPCSL